MEGGEGQRDAGEWEIGQSALGAGTDKKLHPKKVLPSPYSSPLPHLSPLPPFPPLLFIPSRALFRTRVHTDNSVSLSFSPYATHRQTSGIHYSCQPAVLWYIHPPALSRCSNAGCGQEGELRHTPTPLAFPSGSETRHENCSERIPTRSRVSSGGGWSRVSLRRVEFKTMEIASEK